MIFHTLFKASGVIIGRGSNVTPDELEIVNMAKQLFESHATHINVELQKRSSEYLSPLNAASPELLATLVQQLPTFHECVRESNPLVGKMLKLLGKKEVATHDSTIMNENTRMIHNMPKTDYGTKNPTHKSLGKHQMLDEIEIVKKYDTIPIFDSCKQRMALYGENILITPPNLEYSKYCFKEFKNLLINCEGTLYSESLFQIEYRSEYRLSQGIVALSFVSKTGPIKIVSASTADSTGLRVEALPIVDGEVPKIRMKVFNSTVPVTFPRLNLVYNVNTVTKSLELYLPVFINNFLTPLRLTPEKHLESYAASTTCKEFFKLDEFIRNPAPHHPLLPVMQKIQNLLNVVLKFSADMYPSNHAPKMIYASATLSSADAKFHKSAILLEIECFEDYKDYLRLSIRSIASPEVVFSVYQIIVFFLVPHT